MEDGDKSHADGADGAAGTDICLVVIKNEQTVEREASGTRGLSAGGFPVSQGHFLRQETSYAVPPVSPALFQQRAAQRRSPCTEHLTCQSERSPQQDVEGTEG